MLFRNTFYKKSRRYLACLLTAAIMALAMPIAVHAAFAVFLAASPAQPDSDTQVVLKWNPVAGAQMYKISRNVGGTAVDAAIDPDGALEPTTYTDTGLAPDTSYTYILKAYLDKEMNNEIVLTSNQVIARTTRMIRPSGVSAVYDINTKSVTLSWEAASAAATGYVVRVGSGSGAIVVNEANNPAKRVAFLTNEEAPVDYVVISHDGAGGHYSDASLPITVTPLTPPVVTATAIDGAAVVSWGTFSPISDFQLERSKWGGTAWSDWELAKTSLSGTSTTDSPTAGGTYRYRLAAKGNGQYAGSSNASGNVICPKAPISLQASIADWGLIVLSWNIDPSNEAVIKVARKMPDNSYLTIATLDKSKSEYPDKIPVVLGTTYTYRVSAWESDTNAVSSAEVSVTAEIPPAPSNLTLTAESSKNVTLNWQDNSNTEQNFFIERKTDLGGYVRIGTVNSNIITYPDTIEEGHSYAYRIQAYNTLGSSAYSNEISIANNNIVRPNTLTVTPVSASQINLAWSYPATGSYSTVIERKTGAGGTWSVIGTTASGVYTYSNSGLEANTQYFYRVRNSLGAGIMTPAYPDTGIGAYTMLSEFTLSGEAVSAGRIMLHWSGTSAGSEVAIERKMANGSFSVLATVSASTNEWYDTTGLIPGASYTYRIKVKNSMNESVYSRELTVENVYLDAPSNLEVSADSSEGLVLKWRDNSDGETGFEIWRRVYDNGTYGSFVLYDKVGPNKTSYIDKTAHPGVQYYYRVRAYMGEGEQYSAYTVSQSSGLGIIEPPDNLRFDYVSDTSVNLIWDDNSNNESGFRVERRIGIDGEWVRIATVYSSTKSYKYTGLSPYITYYFRIRAYNTTGSYDSFSNEIEITTGKPKAPSNITAGLISSTQARITWKDNSDSETGFKVQRAIVGVTNYRVVAYVERDVTSYVDAGLSGQTQYSYKITAYNGSGEADSASFEMKTGAYVQFSDVAEGFWARDAIINLAGRGIIKGVTETQFKPGNTITKAEFTAMMMRAFQLDTAPVGSLADVKIGAWYYNEVMIAENLGIVSGDSGNRFYPNRMITREEMAVIVAKTLNTVGNPLNAHDNSVLEKFWDRDLISPSALSSIASAVGEGILTGLPGNALSPKKTLTRAEAAAIIYRVLDR